MALPKYLTSLMHLLIVSSLTNGLTPSCIKTMAFSFSFFISLRAIKIESCPLFPPGKTFFTFEILYLVTNCFSNSTPSKIQATYISSIFFYQQYNGNIFHIM